MSRLGYAITTTAAVSLLGVLSLVSFAPKLIWNASASTPVGLYAIEPDRSPDLTDLVAVRAPEPLASFLAEGGYLPRGVPLLKRVAALPGQRVCRSGVAVTVDARAYGRSARARSPRQSAAHLAGLPRHRRWRVVPDELAGPRQPRRPLLRPASRLSRDRPGHPSLHRRGRQWPLRLARADAVTACPIPTSPHIHGGNPCP